MFPELVRRRSGLTEAQGDHLLGATAGDILDVRAVHQGREGVVLYMRSSDRFYPFVVHRFSSDRFGYALTGGGYYTNLGDAVADFGDRA